MEFGEAGPPSMPIHEPERPWYCVGCTAGTVQLPCMLLKVEPVRICPDQLVETSTCSCPMACGWGPVRKCSGLEWNVCGTGEFCADPAALPDVPCAPATDAPITRPTATSASALSHRHIRSEPAKSSASRHVRSMDRRDCTCRVDEIGVSPGTLGPNCALQ